MQSGPHPDEWEELNLTLWNDSPSFLASIVLDIPHPLCHFLFQEYMVYRKHTYMRLDGSSKISERRDMVADFQSRWVKTVCVCVNDTKLLLANRWL